MQCEKPAQNLTGIRAPDSQMKKTKLDLAYENHIKILGDQVAFLQRKISRQHGTIESMRVAVKELRDKIRELLSK